MSVKFEVKITRKVMFDFMLFNTYTSLIGIISVVFGLLNLFLGLRGIGLGDTRTGMMYLAFAAVFLALLPIGLWRNAGKQIEMSKFFENPITYEMDEEGVEGYQDEKKGVTPWSAFIRVASTKTNIIMYMGRNRAVILPREDMGTQQDAVIEMISTHVDPSKVKIRR